MSGSDVQALKGLPIVVEILDQLKRGLPESLIYHTVAHTEGVFDEALCLASGEGLTSRQFELLAIAAAYHDSGFLSQRLDNERIGAEYAEKAMRRHGGYSPAEIELVTQAILDTKVNYGPSGPVQLANTEISGCLLDADIANFGGSDFFEKNKIYMTELERIDRHKFLEETLTLLLRHDWQTKTARRLRQEMKIKNIALIRQQLDCKDG